MSNLFDSIPGIGKVQPEAHTIGRRAVDLLKSIFPQLWVVREYTPDYGIDLDVELFAEDTKMTLGEHVLFQVKGTESLTVDQIQPIKTVNGLGGLESNGPTTTVEVVKFSLDTKLVATVEKMGSAAVVLLAVVDLKGRRAYVVCLNDYIDKILLVQNPGYCKQDHVTIYIPTKNCLNVDAGARLVAWYGKRAKLYSFFCLVNVQWHDLKYEDSSRKVETAKKYAERLARLDVWGGAQRWQILDEMKEDISFFYQNGITREVEAFLKEEKQRGRDIDDPIWEGSYFAGPVSLRDNNTIDGIHQLWERLNNLNCLFDEYVKHWFLPTGMGNML